ncbi:MAG: stage V sporulation protein AC [Clostridia bacterium]|nr:stage V sporulation protein AC [Clostridia bacterium]
MQINNKEYSEIVELRSVKSPKTRDFVLSFVIGGLICVVGELLLKIFERLNISPDIIAMLVPSTLIFISAVLTGLKLYEKIAKYAGAGTLVPITGFANAVVSPAIEFKNEGHVLGIGAKIFTIAGPVILFGTVSSVIYGIVYYIIKVGL